MNRSLLVHSHLFLKLLIYLDKVQAPNLRCNTIAATIFAYGQTSSGKTFTMRGVTESAIADIFGYIQRVNSFLRLFIKIRLTS